MSDESGSAFSRFACQAADEHDRAGGEVTRRYSISEATIPAVNGVVGSQRSARSAAGVRGRGGDFGAPDGDRDTFTTALRADGNTYMNI